MHRNKIEKTYLKRIDELKKYDKAYFEKDNPIV